MAEYSYISVRSALLAKANTFTANNVTPNNYSFNNLKNVLARLKAERDAAAQCTSRSSAVYSTNDMSFSGLKTLIANIPDIDCSCQNQTTTPCVSNTSCSAYGCTCVPQAACPCQNVCSANSVFCNCQGACQSDVYICECQNQSVCGCHGDNGCNCLGVYCSCNPLAECVSDNGCSGNMCNGYTCGTVDNEYIDTCGSQSAGCNDDCSCDYHAACSSNCGSRTIGCTCVSVCSSQAICTCQGYANYTCSGHQSACSAYGCTCVPQSNCACNQKYK